MPIYEFVCEQCGWVAEELRPMKDSGKAKVCECGQKMIRCFNPPARFGMDWENPCLDDSVGVMPNQVAEHRRKHPDIPMTNDGRVIIKNAAERNRIKRSLEKIFSE
jgi:putative FmdB family regulatory protein